MNRVRSLLTKYQLPLFFLLSYLLSWWSLPSGRGLLPHGVAIAAIIVITLTDGKKGVRIFFKRLTNFRAGRLYLAAPAIIVGFILANSAANLLAGGTLFGPPNLPFALVAAGLLILGGQWEEPGWTGYALPALQTRFANTRNGMLIATLTLGVFRGIWHLPLVLVGAIPWYNAVWFTPFVFQPFITWLYNKSGGSVPVVMFFHYLSNLLFTVSPVFTGADKPTYTILYLTFGALLTLALAWKTGGKFGWRGTEDEGAITA